MIEPTDEQLLALLDESDECINELERLLSQIRTPKEPASDSSNTLHGVTCDKCDDFLDKGPCKKHASKKD